MIAVRVQPGHDAAKALADLKRAVLRFPGEHEVEIRVAGHRMTLGPRWQCNASAECLLALERFGAVEEVSIAHPPPAPEGGQHGKAGNPHP